MKQKSLRYLAASAVGAAGLALAIAIPVAQAQQPAEKAPPPAAEEKVERPDPAGQAPEKEAFGKAEQAEEQSLAQTDAIEEQHDAEEFGFHAKFGGPTLGVAVRDVTSEDIASKQLTGQVGAVVTKVEKDSPAASGGLREGDVILSFDGERVRSTRQLSRLVRETPAERQVAVEVMRDGQQQRLQVTPERDAVSWSLNHEELRHLTDKVRDKVRIETERLGREIKPTLRVFGSPPHVFDYVARGLPWSGARLGVSVQPLTPQLAEYFGVESGVLIFSVDADSPAAKAGLTAGDVVTAVDGTTVEDAAAIRRAVRDLDKREATLSVMRDRQSRSVKVTFPEPSWPTPHERV